MTNRSSDGDSAPDFSFLGDDADDSGAQSFDFAEPLPSAPTVQPAQPTASEDQPDPDQVGQPVKNSAAKKKTSPASTRPSKKKPTEAKNRTSNVAQVGANVASADDQPIAASGKYFNALLGYAAALTLLFLFLLVTGRLSLFGNHQLESLPDVKPLRSDEFQLIPPTASLPAGHSLQLGESQRFGDVILTAERVTQEPLKFAHMTSGKEAADLEIPQVLKLWFKVQNVSPDIAFTAWDVDLMCHHSQRGTDIVADEDVLTNSWLLVTKAESQQETRVLNFMHPPESSFNLVGHGGDSLVQPGQTQTCFVAASDAALRLRDKAEAYRWRIQIRKGVHKDSGNGVTTLVDIMFKPNQIAASDGA